MRFIVGLLIFCLFGHCFFGCQSPPQTLDEVIKQEKHTSVRDSYGENRNECFTDDDLANFKRNNVPGSIVRRLRESQDFVNIILDLKSKSEPERHALLLAGRSSYQPTWEEIGSISPAGQTRAGQDAQRIIGATIVDLAEELLALPEEDLRKRARQ